MLVDPSYQGIAALVNNDSSITSFCEAPTFGVLVSNYGPSSGAWFSGIYCIASIVAKAFVTIMWTSTCGSKVSGSTWINKNLMLMVGLLVEPTPCTLSIHSIFSFVDA